MKVAIVANLVICMHACVCVKVDHTEFVLSFKENFRYI
jgi:uncharacterized Fe-S cluster protein YjdI